MSDILVSVGIRIREIRKSKGLTQDQLAELSQFHYSYIGGVERGERNISLSNLAKIADALQVKPQTFFNYEETKTNDVEIELEQILFLLSDRELDQIRVVKNIINDIFSIVPSKYE